MILRVRAVVPATAAALFVLLTVAVLTGWAPLRRLDEDAADGFRRFGAEHPGLIGAVRVLTDVAATVPFFAVGVLLGAILLVRGKGRAALLTAAVTVSVPSLWAIMHLVLPHARPPDGFVTITSYGFPSGHTSNAAALAVLATVLLTPLGRFAWLPSAAAAFVAFAGLSRMMLLAHWPSQVLGGLLLACAVVPALTLAIAPRSAILPEH